MAKFDPTTMLGSIIGLPISLGTFGANIARDRGRRSDYERILREGGAGSIAARQSATRGAREAMNVAAGGQSASRGLNLLTGLRAGERIRAAGAEQAAPLAAQEQQRALRQLSALDISRRAAIGQMGAAAGGALAAFDAQQQAARSREQEVADAEAQRAHDLEVARIGAGQQAVPETPTPEGEGAQAAQPFDTAQIVADAEQGLEYIRALQSPQVRFLIQEGMTPEEAVAEAFPGLVKPEVA